jgi:hypothetical protein
VTIGLGVVSWQFLMVPYARDPSLTLDQKLTSVLLPLADVVVLAVLMRLWSGGGQRPAAYTLLGLSRSIPSPGRAPRSRRASRSGCRSWSPCRPASGHGKRCDRIVLPAMLAPIGGMGASYEIPAVNAEREPCWSTGGPTGPSTTRP